MSQRQGETEEETLQRAMRDPEIAVCATRRALHRTGGRTDALFTENHERPDHAVDLATSAGEPGRATGPHEEPGCAAEYHEAHQRGHYQDGAVVCLVRWFSCFSRSDCFVWKSSIPLYLYSSLWARVIQVSFAQHHFGAILNGSEEFPKTEYVTDRPRNVHILSGSYMLYEPLLRHRDIVHFFLGDPSSDQSRILNLKTLSHRMSQALIWPTRLGYNRH